MNILSFGLKRLFLFSVKVRDNLRLCDASNLIEIQNKQPWFGGFLYGVFYSFSSHAGVLNAAVGHVVDPERGIIVNDDASDVEIIECVPYPSYIICKHACLKSLICIRDRTEGVFECVI